MFGWRIAGPRDEFADQEAVATVITITAGNFRLINRLMSQVRRIKELKRLSTVTRELVEPHSREQDIVRSRAASHKRGTLQRQARGTRSNPGSIPAAGQEAAVK
jgi:hypothetical protein